MLEDIIIGFDKILRGMTDKQEQKRPSPAKDMQEPELSVQEKRESIEKMRVNHSGEICAQALYVGQSLAARDKELKKKLEAAQVEEYDHLKWCKERIDELDGRTSIFNPIWYVSSLSLGFGMALVSDRYSLSFLAETEEQVSEHLKGHLQSLPVKDTKSRAIVSQMLSDESKHAQMAIDAGGTKLPGYLCSLMRHSANIFRAISTKI